MLSLTLLLALAGCPPGAPSVRPVQDPAPTAEAPAKQGDAWQRLVERDRRVSFSPRTAAMALEVLGRVDLTANEREAALFAIGAGGALSERPRLLSWAQEGSPGDRSAAVLGLGELGRVDIPFLKRLSESSDGELAPYAILALLRTGGPDALARAEALSKDASSPYAETAADLLVFVRTPAASKSSPAAQRWLDLRWDAARRFGLIDGEAWSEKVLAGLKADQQFLDRVVYMAGARLKQQAVRDIFLELVMQPGSPARLAGAVSAIPTELDQMLINGVWAPADEVEWTTLLKEIADQRLESLCPNILRQARVIPSLRTFASLLLARGGQPEGMPLLELELTGNDPLARSRIAEVLGQSHQTTFIPRLAALLNDADPNVRNSALVAVLMLEYGPARERIRTRLLRADDPERDILIQTLCRNARSVEVRNLLVEALPQLAKGEQVLVATALAVAGRSTERDLVCDVLEDEPPKGELGVQMVRALADGTSAKDRAVLHSVFPVDDDVPVNVELAIALIVNRDPITLSVLRAALWQEPWDRSILAGGLMAAVAGVDILQEEISRPPVRASTRDMRRVGFALGEWGGVTELEKLSQHTSASDPALQGAVLGALGGRTR